MTSQQNAGKPMARAARLGAAALIGFSLTAIATAATPASRLALADVKTASSNWLLAQVDSQKKVDGLADERRSLADEYRNTLRESDGLKLYIQQLRAQLRSQEEEMEVVRGESRDLDRTNIEILPLMQNMLTSLEQFVSLDLPFLSKDRKERVEKLKDMMPRADVTVSEKYRRIVEAFQIEMEYGRTIEAYKQDIDSKTVDVLRVGRVGLFYQTPDGRETGYWDADKKAWAQDNAYRDGVTEGIKVARKQTSPNLIIVPVKTATKGQ